ncbi:MAG: PQQ-binding-like beta-propeller repeat protein [Acidimicrobiales bacterium]
MLAIAAFVAVLAVPIVYFLVTDEPSDPAEQPAPPEENLGYDDLAPPTSRPVFLDEQQLGGSLRFHDSVGCVGNASSRLTRISPDGVASWSVPLPWIGEPFVRDGDTVVSVTATERPSLFALDVASGAALWQRFVDDIGGVFLAAVDDVVVLQAGIRGEDEMLRGFDIRTGVELWTRAVERWGALALVDGHLIHSDVSGVSSIDPVSGAVLWDVPFADAEEISIVLQEGVGGRVGTPTEGLFVRAWPATVHRLDPASGEILWSWTAQDERVSVSLQAEIDRVLAFTTGFSYSSSDDPPADGSTDTIGALDVETGEVIWSRPGGDRARLDGPYWSVSPGYLESETSFEELPGGIFDAVTGEVLGEWSDADSASIRGGGDGYLVVAEWDEATGSRQEWLVDPASGEDAWRPDAPVEGIDLVQRVGDLLLVTGFREGPWDQSDSTPEGFLWAIDADTLDERFTFETEDRMTHPVLPMDGGDLLVTSGEPEVFCD